MAILISVLAAVLILGSALWVLPSSRQRQQMTLRRAAMLKGLQVKLIRIKDLEYPGEELSCMVYRLNRPYIKGADNNAWMLYRHSDPGNEQQVPGWIYNRSEGRYRFAEGAGVAAILAQLPDDIIAVQATAGAISVYWHERGEMDDVNTILRVLTELMAV